MYCCSQCSIKRTKTLEDYKILARENNGSYILTFIPHDTTTKVEGWLCEYGHIWETTYSIISSLRCWCPVCANVVKKTIEDYCNIANEKGFQYILDNIPKSVNTNITGWLCANSHLIDKSYTTIRCMKNNWCYECEYTTRPKTLNDYQTIAIFNKFKYILNKIPQNTSYSIEGWKCNKGHVWKTSYKSIKQYGSCLYCSNWKSEHIARDIIEEIMGLKFNKVRPMFLKGLELDGYCKPLKLAFEYQGRQHYEYIPFFHRKEGDFKNQQKRDRMKSSICNQMGIVLLLIPYKFNYKNKKDMKTYIIDQLRTHGFIFYIHSKE